MFQEDERFGYYFNEQKISKYEEPTHINTIYNSQLLVKVESIEQSFEAPHVRCMEGRADGII